MAAGSVTEPVLPDAHWGKATAKLPDWRREPESPDPDDEALPETPPDVVAALGFDPLAESEDGDGAA